MAEGAPCQLNTHTLPVSRLSKKPAECEETFKGRRGSLGVSWAKHAEESTVAVRISETNLSIAIVPRLRDVRLSVSGAMGLSLSASAR